MSIYWKTIFKWSVLLCVVMPQPLFFWSGLSVLNPISHKWNRFYTKQICLKILIAPHTYDHTESRYIGTGLPKTMSFYIKGTFALAMAVARLPIYNIYYTLIQLNQPRQYIEWKANICNYSLSSSIGSFLPMYKNELPFNFCKRREPSFCDGSAPIATLIKLILFSWQDQVEVIVLH